MNLGRFGDAGVDSSLDDGGNPSDACMFCGDASAPVPFKISPSTEQDITVNCGSPPPTVQLSATALDNTPISVAWTSDQVGIGTIAPANGSSTTFTPTGTAGGIVDVLATYNKQTIATQIFVKLTCVQNGSDSKNCPVAQTTADLLNRGGMGGVGGDGCGGAVTDLTPFKNPNGSATQTYIYPYANTLWPQGLLPPLLQWSSSFGGADAIKIDLTTTSGSFSWSGTFSPPAILQQTGTPFDRHPIPNDVWAMATNTAGTKIHNQIDRLTVSLTIAKNGQGYTPFSQTWDVARGALKGAVYYGSYGTSLSNSSWNTGASVLSIEHGANLSTLVTSKTQCQVCHSVAAKGSDMVLESNDYPGNGNDWGAFYDLTNPKPPGTTLPQTTPGLFVWGAASPDGSLYFSNSAPCHSTNASACLNDTGNMGGLAAGTDHPSGLYSLPSGATVLTSTQIASQLSLTTELGGSLPEFSPDGKHVAFTFFKGGPGVDNKSADGKSIAVVDFDQTTKTFSNLRTIYTPTCSGCTAVHPFFTPSSDQIVFDVITHSNSYFAGTTADYGLDMSSAKCGALTGATAELWWVDLATKTPHRLDAANGIANGQSYLPTGSDSHGNDTALQFDPTVAPIASGGYVWIAFTSRRLYGSVATMNPWCSCSDCNYNQSFFAGHPMTKKLWVAGFDLNATPGTDPSHPAFYLPAQELTAGNSRSFWVLDPCVSDGSTCESGDQCCGGHCVSSDDGGAATCGTPKGCSGNGDTCTTSAQCCGGLQCVGGPDNGHCDVIPVK
jgi:hypothetical protein